MANPATDGLKIGDFITLKTGKWESFLGAEGILASDLYVHDALEEFDDSIFQIHSQRQYSASRELLNFLETQVCTVENANIARKSVLCKSAAGNDCHQIVITNFKSSEADLAKREAIVLTGRVPTDTLLTKSSTVGAEV